MELQVIHQAMQKIKQLKLKKTFIGGKRFQSKPANKIDEHNTHGS